MCACLTAQPQAHAICTSRACDILDSPRRVGRPLPRRPLISAHCSLHLYMHDRLYGPPSARGCSACGPVLISPRCACLRLILFCTCPPLCVRALWPMPAWVWLTCFFFCFFNGAPVGVHPTATPPLGGSLRLFRDCRIACRSHAHQLTVHAQRHTHTSMCSKPFDDLSDAETGVHVRTEYPGLAGLTLLLGPAPSK